MSQLICIPHPIIHTRTRYVRDTGGEVGVLIAEKATRINRRIVQFELADMDDAELAWLLTVWDEGRGQVVPFLLTLPGETERRWIFTEPLTITYDNANKRSGTVVIRDLGEPVEEPESTSSSSAPPSSSESSSAPPSSSMSSSAPSSSGSSSPPSSQSSSGGVTSQSVPDSSGSTPFTEATNTSGSSPTPS